MTRDGRLLLVVRPRRRWRARQRARRRRRPRTRARAPRAAARSRLEDMFQPTRARWRGRRCVSASGRQHLRPRLPALRRAAPRAPPRGRRAVRPVAAQHLRHRPAARRARSSRGSCSAHRLLPAVVQLGVASLSAEDSSSSSRRSTYYVHPDRPRVFVRRRRSGARRARPALADAVALLLARDRRGTTTRWRSTPRW